MRLNCFSSCRRLPLARARLRSRNSTAALETLLARLVYLAKNYILLPSPTLVEFAEATVAVSLPDESAGSLPKPTATSDGDAAATANERRENLGGLARAVVLPPSALRTMPAYGDIQRHLALWKTFRASRSPFRRS
jgi:hypothetical protein